MNVKDLINAKNSTPVLYTDFTRLKLKKPLSFLHSTKVKMHLITTISYFL